MLSVIRAASGVKRAWCGHGSWTPSKSRHELLRNSLKRYERCRNYCSFTVRSTNAPQPADLETQIQKGDVEDQERGSAEVVEENETLLNWNLEDIEQRDGLGFGFSAGGLLFPYFVGNAVALKRLGLISEDTIFAGASAGSLISSCLVCDIEPEVLMDTNLIMYRELREKGTIGNVRGVVETYCHKLLPDDAHLRANNRLHVAIARVSRQRPFMQPVYINEFFSKEDLIQALLTSSHVPLYMNSKVTSTYRGRTCVDGGLMHFIPTPPCTNTVKICCFPALPFKADIAPGAFGECNYSLRQMLQFAILPPNENKIVELFEMGVNDVLEWAKVSEVAGKYTSDVLHNNSS